MILARLRSTRSLLAAALLAACAPAPAKVPEPVSVAKEIVDRGCSRSVENPDAEFHRRTAAAADPMLPPTQRAEAVHGVACLLAATKPTLASGFFAVLTLGLSEVALGDALHASVMSGEQRLAIMDILGRAACDPSPDVHEVAMYHLGWLPSRTVVPVLGRAASCDIEPHAVAAVEALEARALKKIEGERNASPDDALRGDWSDLAAAAPPLEEAARSEKLRLRKRATAALAAIDAALDEAVLARARAADRRVLAVPDEDLKVPRLGTALRRAAPAFRARLTDRDDEIRLEAAAAVWRLEGASDESLAALAAGLWTGIEVPAPPADPAIRQQLDATLRNIDKSSLDFRQRDALVAELERLAKAGPAAEPALEPIRACLSVSSDKVQMTAASALVFVGQDRQMLPVLRKTHERIFADSTSAYGGPGSNGALAAAAILYLEPDDADARRALRLGPGPLLDAVTRRAIVSGNDRLWLIRLLLRRQAASRAGRSAR